MDAIDRYLAALAPEKRAALEHVRGVIRAHVPAAVEAISYGMPAFRYKGAYLVGYCAFQHHLSLFPTAEPIAALRDELGAYRLAKGTIQFTLEQTLPDELIVRLVQVRMRAIDGSH